MAKQTDLEKRLDELEARQNMFFGGTVPDLSNIPNLPNVPNLTQTGATPQVQQPAPPPAPVTMNQQKTRPPSGVQTGASIPTPPNLNLGNINIPGGGLGNIDFSAINTAAAKAAADKAAADKAAADKAAADKAAADKAAKEAADKAAKEAADKAAKEAADAAAAKGLDGFGSDRMYTDMFGRTIGNKDRSQVNLSATKQVANDDGTYTRIYYDYDGNEIGSRVSESTRLGGTQDKEGEAVLKTEDEDKDETPMWVEVSRSAPNEEGLITVLERDDNPNSPTYGATRTRVEKEDTSQDNTNTSGGQGSGGQGTGGPLETRFGDVLNQMDHLAGLSGKTPDLLPTSKVTAQNIQVDAGELETTAGVNLTTDRAALTDIISDEQIKALQAAGYNFKENANTVAATTDTHAKVTNQAFNAQTLNQLTDDVTGQTGTPVVGESIIAQAPSAESIEVKKANAPDSNTVAEVDRRGTPSVDDYTGTYSDKIQAAKRSMDIGDTVPELDPRTANQATAQVMTELRDNAVMEAAQSSTDEQTRTTAQAITQEMSNVPVEATVQGQLENLMAQFADGKTPAYAAGAIRNAQAMMAQRGLSASSMAGAAIMQAAMESSLPIAAQDAQVFREINLNNLNNKQQVALANQAAALQLSLSDLSNRQQEALQNSTNGFKLQSQSLSNMQQASLANAQLRAALQDRELSFAQQRAVTNAAKYSEIENINLSNEQQGIMQDSVNNVNFAMSNLSFQQQRRLAKAQVDAALTGQELTNDQQRAVINAARIAEVNNLKFTEEQQRNLADAQIMQSLNLADLDAEMRTAISNAATYANMDMANLNNRQQAEVLNAQAFLNLDLQGLSNKQQGEVLKYQAKTQALFNDAAADNARKQFNAQSENQVDEFFAQLGAQVAQQNANRVAAMKQFNVDQTNAQSRFNVSTADSRDKFNSTMTAQINQSNAAWRRQTNTINTAAQNEANRINALNNFSMNQQALNNIWQQYRDESSWLFTQGLTREQFGHELVKLSLQGDVNERLFNHKFKASTWQSIGGTAMRVFAKQFGLLDD